MSNISDRIERMLDDLLDEHDGMVKISRNKLAEEIQVVPSQINYVLSTRFANSHGYIVESRRGGGGSITIRRISTSSPAHAIRLLVKKMPDALSQQDAYLIIANFERSDLLDKRTGQVLKAAVSDRVFTEIERRTADRLRSQILKNSLIELATMM